MKPKENNAVVKRDMEPQKPSDQIAEIVRDMVGDKAPTPNVTILAILEWLDKQYEK